MPIIKAKVIEDSISQLGHRLTTLQLMYPRFILPEFNTHRMFSRNASSSRAIPVAKVIEQVKNSPAAPIHWGANQPGMQAHIEVPEDVKVQVKELWLKAAQNAADITEQMNSLGLHKQVANRILEPFVHISVIVTATEWANFFELRDHEDAQPEIKALAQAIKNSMAHSLPVLRDATKPQAKESNWHLPYVTNEERFTINSPMTLAKISAARCARVSYLTHDGQSPNIEKDLALYERLVGSVPLHASPVEHQACPLSTSSFNKNFKGWYQFRTTIEQKMERKS
jgi:thymidylate synthase ThyX